MPPVRIASPLLARALAKGVAPAYYLHGEATLLKDEALTLLVVTLLDPALRDFNLDLLSARQLEPDGLAAAMAALPMMADRRVVVVRDIEAWKRKSKAKQAALAALDRPSQETVVIFVQGDEEDPDEEIAGRCVAVDCASPVGEALDAWLDDRLGRVGVALTPEAREHLLRATAGDAGLLAAEVAKLGGLVVEGPLDRDIVGDLVGIRFGETADDWRDAIFRDEIAAAVALTPRLLELSGNSGVKLVTSLGSSFLVLRWARAAATRQKLRDQALARSVQQLCFSTRPGVGSYGPFAQLVAEVVGRWPDTRLRRAVDAVLQADIALKSTTVSDETGILTDLLITLAASRPVAAA